MHPTSTYPGTIRTQAPPWPLGHHNHNQTPNKTVAGNLTDCGLELAEGTGGSGRDGRGAAEGTVGEGMHMGMHLGSPPDFAG
eukprot:scaffold149844_cov32-Tisochrysis_lutea.AAC.1